MGVTGAEIEEPVEIRPNSTTNSPNHPRLTELCAVFTSLVAVVVAERALPRRELASVGVIMFRGNHPTRVDEKGRLKVPAEFKRVIDEKYGAAILHHQPGWQGCQVYPFEEWERIEQKLAGLSTFNPTKKKFLDRVNYYGQHGRDGWSGAVAATAVVAGSGADQGRSGGDSAI